MVFMGRGCRSIKQNKKYGNRISGLAPPDKRAVDNYGKKIKKQGKR